MALLARLGGPPDPADALDALAIALTTFLVLFAFVIHPVLAGGWVSVVAAIIFPLGALLILTTASQPFTRMTYDPKLCSRTHTRPWVGCRTRRLVWPPPTPS